MAFVLLDECISIPLSFPPSFSLFLISFSDFMSRISVNWDSSPELSCICHTSVMPICAPMLAKIRNKDSCIFYHSCKTIFVTLPKGF